MPGLAGWRIGVLYGACALAGCAETVQTTSPVQGRDGATITVPPPPQGYYKVGTPYTVNGVTYTPAAPAENFAYVETGVASWYGTEFHGKRTANGEVFDMNAPSAAHRTLPMPSLVRVTNLENGRTLDLRVNDRGPFVGNRIIDISRRGAQLLGFHGKGTAQVRVEIVPEESRRLATLARLGQIAEPLAQAPQPDDGRLVESQWAMVAATQGPAAPVVLQAGLDGKEAPPASHLFIQAGAFTDFSNAVKVRDDLARFAASHLSQVTVGGNKFFRVRVGPAGTRENADRLLTQIVAAGHREARLIAE
jgi:rare lipoprotein A